jgi:hypothetical protein
VFMGSSLAATMIGWSMIEADVLQLTIGAISTFVAVGTFLLFVIWRESSPQDLLAEEAESRSTNIPAARDGLELNES